ncbi:hypothetical protein Patl1_12179 [Pistacia atlantica]|uniref:Uncharacterized protein n=1 Tax=Pistacia atlantica TaxID=434234 RepID=A0ACC1A4K7_9ROSI|nr:hypothetical protein Patl1_12179 [Pistacia atlantica]
MVTSTMEQPSQPIPLATFSSKSFQSAMGQPVIIEMVNPSQPVASSTQHMALSSSQLTGIFVMVHHIGCKFIPSYMIRNMMSFIRSCNRKMMPCIWSSISIIGCYLQLEATDSDEVDCIQIFADSANYVPVNSFTESAPVSISQSTKLVQPNIECTTSVQLVPNSLQQAENVAQPSATTPIISHTDNGNVSVENLSSASLNSVSQSTEFTHPTGI